ncbi:hypothetical protein SAMN05192574_104242 [Mucilaginibacter gossypiicola]|uniref:Uncharacterized protein n=1 Tax=Mucilaginibacter gossypiicola TaxID=551995 RepID=A0A1H8JM39_9SPHI|nr:hypothetical protein [Mucilaginibacter gossypiicola]SEN81719.1 hypothetical protein SAMN05192574_104242 [Mucilaginibacter gossypiicola]
MRPVLLFLILLCFGRMDTWAQDPDKNNATPDTTAPVTPVATVNPTSPAADDRNYDKIPVTYDMSTGTFDRVLPFDRPFMFYFKGIPANVSYIEIVLIKDNLKPFKKPKPGTYGPNDLDVYAVKLKSDRWERPDGAVGANINECKVRSRWKMLPNTSYSVDIITGIKSTLTSAQKSDLKAKLQASLKVSGLITTLARTGLAGTFDANALINQKNTESRQVLSEAVKDVNPNYDLSGLDPAKATITVQNLLSNFQLMMNATDKLFDMTTAPSYAATHAKIVNLQTALKTTINWGVITKDDAEYKTIVQSLKTINDAIAADDGNKAIFTQKTADIQSKLDNVPNLRDAISKQFIEDVILPNTYIYLRQNDTYVDDFQKNAKLYVNLDVGYAYVGRMDRGLAYSGFNIYFRPIDRSVPLSQYDSFGDWLAVRSSLLIGITLASVEQDNVRKGFIGNKGLMLGYGFKLISFFKINAGTMVNYRYNNNPLLSTDHYHTSLSPFVSFSIDLDAKSLLSGIGDSIFK